MRYLCYTLLFFWVCFPPSIKGADHPVIDLEALRQYHSQFLRRGYVLDQGWKFNAGDNAEWSLPELDDSDWDDWTDGIDLGGWRRANWMGMGWFRLRFETSAELANIPLVLFIGQIGASEIYLDGKNIGQFGTVGDGPKTEKIEAIANVMFYVPVHLQEGSEHVLAVRFSNFRSITDLLYDMPVGFLLILAEREYSQALRTQVTRFISGHQILFAIPLGITLLHFMLFLFNTANREDLYYALFTMSIAGLIFFPMGGSFTHDLDTLLCLEAFFKISLVSTGVFQLWFIYHFFRGTPTLFFKVTAGVGCVLGLFAWTLDVNIYFVFLLMTYPEAVRTIFKAFCKKRPGAGIVGVGVLIFIGGSMYQSLLEMDIIDRSMLFFPYIYGALGLMLSMSIYLAQIFARTHQNLERQLVQAKELSALALAQERETLRLEKQAEEDREKRQLLEADNALKSVELEEAQRRQSIFESLQQKNQALQETQAKLVQSEKMASLGNLVAGIAHEINTPVGAINSMHDTLMRAVDRLNGVLEADYHEVLQNNRPMRAALQVIQDANRVIATGTKRVTEIVRSLRSFARLDEAEMKEANLHEGIENTLTLVHHNLKNRIEVVRDYSDIPPVTCFPSRLNQVFLNLLVNAGQAIDGQGKITVSTRLVGDEVAIAIADSGKGIPTENLARIFDPGFTTKGVGVGTGLGLSICYQIVQDHKGSIRVNSQEGEGTTFTIHLPLSIDEGT